MRNKRGKWIYLKKKEGEKMFEIQTLCENTDNKFRCSADRWWGEIEFHIAAFRVRLNMKIKLTANI